MNSYLNVLVLMYADDTIIMSDSEQAMKQALMSLSSYCNEWRLKVNCSKTKIVVFSRGMVHTGGYDFRFGSEAAAAVVNDYKYLGITFSYNGRFRRGELVLVE